MRFTKNAETLFAFQDGLGSVTGLAQGKQLKETYSYSSFGTPTIKDPQGNILPESVYSNNYLFTGRELDSEAELYNYRAREYDATIGRFLQKDPLTWGPDDPRIFTVSSLMNRIILPHPNLLIVNRANQIDGISHYKKVYSNLINSIGQNNPRLLHPYLYVLNNPIIFTDPFGYQAGIGDQAIGTGLIGLGVVIIGYSGGTPIGWIGGGALILGGVYFMVANPIHEYTVQKPMEKAVRKLGGKWFEDLDELDRQEGRCLPK